MLRRAAAAVSVRAASTLRARAASGLEEHESGERSAAPGGRVSKVRQPLEGIGGMRRVEMGSEVGWMLTVDDDVGPGELSCE